EQLAQRLLQLVLAEHAHREVDRDRELQRRKVRDGPLEHMERKFLNAAGIFNGAHKAVRPNEATVRMHPTDQRLSARDLIAQEVKLGLIGNPYVAPTQRLLELVEDGDF